MRFGKREFKDRDAYKNYLRNLKNFRGWSEERLEAYVATKEGGGDPMAAADDSASLEESLTEPERVVFRQKVKRLLDAVVRLGADREVMRPAAEKAAFYDLVVDKELKLARKSGGINQRNLKDMLVGYAGLLDLFGITPEKLRAAGQKSDESLSEAVARSRDAATKVRTNAKAAREEEERLLGDRA